jgi:hypothetical protein
VSRRKQGRREVSLQPNLLRVNRKHITERKVGLKLQERAKSLSGLKVELRMLKVLGYYWSGWVCIYSVGHTEKPELGSSVHLIFDRIAVKSKVTPNYTYSSPSI